MDVKKESLKELRNRILKLFGESLDDYIKDSESLSQQIQVLNGLRADTRSDIARLTRERDDITSTVTRYQEMRDKLKKELEIEAKTVREEIQNTKTQADSALTRREGEVDLNRKKATTELERLTNYSRELENREELLNSREVELNKKEIWLDDRLKTYKTHVV